jgi:TldD protein
MLLDRQVAQEILDHALKEGASFADLFVERDNRQTASILSSQVHRLNTGIDFGVGVRLIFSMNGQHEVFYGYTNSTAPEDLKSVVNKLSAQRRRPQTHGQEFRFSKSITPQFAKPGEMKIHEALDFMKKIDQEARRYQSKLSQVEIDLIQRIQEVSIYNTEGLEAHDIRPYLRIMARVIAEDKGEQSSGYDGPGILGGLEQFTRLYEPKLIAAKACDQAMATLHAPPCPAGKMPVVLANAFGGVIFHEACGHLLETTSVQKKASVFHDKLGEQIAHPCVNAVDDGTIDGKWGSISVDDEGLPTQKTQLIKEGILNHFIVDRVGALKTGYAATGSGRRQSYRFAPASRMRNTFIEAGPDSFDDMIKSIDNGLFCKALGGGSVSPGTGEFNFAAIESYRIEKGKITHPVKGATLIGTGPEILKKISMVGNDLEMSAGMCGSVSGAVPVTVGQPSLKIDDILVGGSA